MSGERKPEDVFTPTTIASREMFEKRNEPELNGNPGLQDNLRDALRQRGNQILIWGDTGVGKSSLLAYAAEDADLGTVLVQCTSGMGFDDVLDAAIRKVIDIKAISKTRSRAAESEVSGGGGLPWIANLTGRIKGSLGETVAYEVIDKNAVDVLTDAMGKAGKPLIVLDNFQNISAPDTRKSVAEFMEGLADRAGQNPGDPDFKCIVIGIATDADGLFGTSGSFRRRTTDVGVPRMPDEEVREVLRRGFGLLGLSADAQILEQLTFYSDGFPYFAHLLGLYLARAARRAGHSHVTEDLLEPALERAAKAVTASYDERARAAFEAGGDVQPRKNIMRLLANSAAREWRSADVITLWEAEFDARPDYSFLLTALAQLAGDKYGKLLRRSETRGRYVYRFEEPLFRPYLRISNRL